MVTSGDEWLMTHHLLKLLKYIILSTHGDEWRVVRAIHFFDKEGIASAEFRSYIGKEEVSPEELARNTGKEGVASSMFWSYSGKEGVGPEELARNISKEGEARVLFSYKNS